MTCASVERNCASRRVASKHTERRKSFKASIGLSRSSESLSELATCSASWRSSRATMRTLYGRLSSCWWRMNNTWLRNSADSTCATFCSELPPPPPSCTRTTDCASSMASASALLGLPTGNSTRSLLRRPCAALAVTGSLAMSASSIVRCAYLAADLRNDGTSAFASVTMMQPCLICASTWSTSDGLRAP